MKKSILTAERLKQEIIDSHHRSRQYGIDQEKRRPEQKRLSSTELENRRIANKDLLEVGCKYMVEGGDGKKTNPCGDNNLDGVAYTVKCVNLAGFLTKGYWVARLL